MLYESLHEIVKESAIEVLRVTEEQASAVASKIVERMGAGIWDFNIKAPQSNQRDDGEMLHTFGQLAGSEVAGFVANAKKLGTRMSFDEMEMGILAAGRKEMRNGLAEIMNSLEFGKQTDPDRGDTLENRGRRKKNS